MTAPSSWAASRPYHSERSLFSHLFFSMLCLRLSKNCSAFFCLLVRSLPLSLPPPLSLSSDIAAIDVSNWACCFASYFAACEAFKASLSASAPSLAQLFASWPFWFRWFCCLEKPVWSSLVVAASRTCFSTSPKAVMRSRDGSLHSALVAIDFLRS